MANEWQTFCVYTINVYCIFQIFCNILSSDFLFSLSQARHFRDEYFCFTSFFICTKQRMD